MGRFGGRRKEEELREQMEEKEMQVLEEKEESIAPETQLGTTHTYALADKEKTASASRSTEKVDVTTQPEQLEVIDDGLAAKYEEAQEEEKQRTQKEDFSDMVAEICISFH